MLILTLKLLLAHFTGDFVLQTNKSVRNRTEHKIKSLSLYYHILIHFILLLVVLQFQTMYALGISIILFTHYLIDLIKSYLAGRVKKTWLFIADQLLHLFVIGWVVHYYEPFSVNIAAIYQASVLLFLITMVMITYVAAVIIKICISKWRVEDASLNEAGKYIGMMERLFIFFFATQGIWSGIGFLLAAKSIFRFGDLTKNNDRKLTEYIMIGTLLSFGMAIALALLYNYIKTLTS